MSKPRQPVKRNPVARALREPLYRKRIVRDRRRAERAGYQKHRQQVAG